MSIPSAWETLGVDDLPNEDLRWLARTHGIHVAVSMWRRCAGTAIEFPIRLPKAYAIRFIREHFDPHDSNIRQLARSLGLSERTIQEYLGARPEATKVDPVPQLSLI